MKRCVVCHKLAILHLFTAAEFRENLWVCSLKCWRVAASAVEYDLDFIYLPTDA